MPNDVELLTEIESFWNKPGFLVSTMSSDSLSRLAVQVVRWLEVSLALSSLERVFKFSDRTSFPPRNVKTHQKERYRLGNVMSGRKHSDHTGCDSCELRGCGQIS